MDEHSALAQLLKPIYLEDAPCKGLKAAFGLPPDCNDYIDYFCSVLPRSPSQVGGAAWLKHCRSTFSRTDWD